MNATLYYKLRVLRIGELKDACEKAISEVLGPECRISVSYPRYPSPGVTDAVSLDTESLRPIVDLDDVNFTIIGYDKELGFSKVWLTFQTALVGTSFKVIALGDQSFQCLEAISSALAFEQTERPLDDLDTLEARVATLEKMARDAASNPKCFVSFKFDDAETVAQVNCLKRLLTALHIEFLTGEQFEPRRIEDKVKARLRADVNFLIAIISKAGESKWLRDEMADAHSRDLWIIILLEKGATFDKGIFGTLEYIPYTVAIEQTFPALLEGINFVKASGSNNV